MPRHPDGTILEPAVGTQIIRWYIAPLVDHVDPDYPRKVLHSWAWRGYGARRAFPFASNTHALVRIRTTPGNHNLLTAAGQPAGFMPVPRLATRYSDAPAAFRSFLNAQGIAGLRNNDTLAQIVDKVLAALEPGVSRSSLALVGVQDGVAFNEATMEED